ncbi:uncharacterized protein AMSG_10391 [Thecamonas trahens ATCC 50062]|uniref:PH domain-containing protein n=1 Tax=Thecamonas trahens ATCC 50062 TaxID=461836 RepID=A0A0L0DSW3_THETB|nr:hypothetical protein AMSG_10391 [Thecamonas trahens ATCC 50062]KNC54543.1 hypothetical protein AMSG_10391 [Thecamonas trahens ATCC 50062]|eukprot:XP_013753559.1 hypothetical protein AMSG_10391 [Thecamonas trahens ATCC 50062]
MDTGDRHAEFKQRMAKQAKVAADAATRTCERNGYKAYFPNRGNDCKVATGDPSAMALGDGTDGTESLGPFAVFESGASVTLEGDKIVILTKWGSLLSIPFVLEWPSLGALAERRAKLPRAPIAHTGNVVKMSKAKRLIGGAKWQKRHLVMTGTKFAYFRSEGEVAQGIRAARGTFSLTPGSYVASADSRTGCARTRLPRPGPMGKRRCGRRASSRLMCLRRPRAWWGATTCLRSTYRASTTSWRATGRTTFRRRRPRSATHGLGSLLPTSTLRRPKVGAGNGGRRVWQDCRTAHGQSGRCGDGRAARRFVRVQCGSGRSDTRRGRWKGGKKARQGAASAVVRIVGRESGAQGSRDSGGSGSCSGGARGVVRCQPGVWAWDSQRAQRDAELAVRAGLADAVGRLVCTCDRLELARRGRSDGGWLADCHADAAAGVVPGGITRFGWGRRVVWG